MSNHTNLMNATQTNAGQLSSELASQIVPMSVAVAYQDVVNMVLRHLAEARQARRTGTVEFKFRLNQGGIIDKRVATEFQEK